MTATERDVTEFHTAFGLPIAHTPAAHIPPTLAELRMRLIREEVNELADAVADLDIIAIADALADIVYVAYGTALTYGIDLDAALTEVHRSNMTKLDAAGRPVLRADGKVIKSDRYEPPNIAAAIGAVTA